VKRILGVILVAVSAIGSIPAAAFATPPPDRSWQHYFAVKTVMQGFYDEDSMQQRRARDPSQYDLSNCEDGSNYTNTGNDKPTVTSRFADIAFNVIVWREALRHIGYPAQLWQPTIVAWEQRRVDRTIALSAPRSGAFAALDPPDMDAGALIAQMASRLNAYQSGHPALPKIVEIGGCGAGGATVSIATAPLAAQVMFIPTFFYQLCKVQRQNADDPNGCPQWREALEGKLQSVEGDYMYFARWSDGVVRRGKLSFDMNDDGHTITLRKP
jgi:hypothetical protein